MKSIKHIVESIRTELDGAENYAKRAMEYRDSDHALAEAYAKAADNEMSTIDLLHVQAARIIQAYRASGKSEVPAAMQAVWDWEHEHMIDRIARIKVLLTSYRTPRP